MTNQPLVVAGVDTHNDTHYAAVIAVSGEAVDADREVANTSHGVVGVASTRFGAVFSVGDVADPVEAVLTRITDHAQASICCRARDTTTGAG